MNTVVLVEGESDHIALATLARRQGRDLTHVEIVVLGGSKNVHKALEQYGARDHDRALAGLYDIQEEDDVGRTLQRTGIGTPRTRADLEALGFFACDTDLEDELIEALGITRALQVVEAAGELPSFRTLQKQPAQQGRRPEAQLRRFIGSKSGRKARYAQLLVEALDLDRVPRPLAELLDCITREVEQPS